MKVIKVYQVYDLEGNIWYTPFYSECSAVYMATHYAPEGSFVIEVELIKGE